MATKKRRKKRLRLKSSFSHFLIEVLSKEKLDFILENKYNETYYPIVSEKYYIDKYFEKYVEYKEYHEKTSISDVIAIVNVKSREA